MEADNARKVLSSVLAAKKCSINFIQHSFHHPRCSGITDFLCLSKVSLYDLI